MSLTHETGFIAALASVASGQRGNSPEVRAHSASEDARGRAGDTRPEPGSSARAAPVSVYFETFAPAAASAKATVVMVHGGAHSGACYQRTADGRSGWAYRFAEHGYRVVVPDWPGTGRSGYIGLDKLDGATVVEGLGALISSLGAPVILLTHSMSGPYGWRLLELHGDVIDTVVGVAPGPPGNIQKAAPVHAESETHIETEAFGGRVRVDKSAPVVGSRDFVERKLVGASRYFPRDRLESYAASLNAIAPKLWLERQNIHGSQLRVGDPRKLAGKRVLVITGTDDLDHSRGAALASEASGQRGDSKMCARRTLALNQARRRALMEPSSRGSRSRGQRPTSAFSPTAVLSAMVTC